MTCEPDSIGPTCQVPMFPDGQNQWTCPECGQVWHAETNFWRTP